MKNLKAENMVYLYWLIFTNILTFFAKNMLMVNIDKKESYVKYNLKQIYK